MQFPLRFVSRHTIKHIHHQGSNVGLVSLASLLCFCNVHAPDIHMKYRLDHERYLLTKPLVPAVVGRSRRFLPCTLRPQTWRCCSACVLPGLSDPQRRAEPCFPGAWRSSLGIHHPGLQAQQWVRGPEPSEVGGFQPNAAYTTAQSPQRPHSNS